MLIADIYDPPAPQGSAEALIVLNVKEFYEELHRIIFDTKLTFSPLTGKGKDGETRGAWGLSEAFYNAFKIPLESCSWQPLHSLWAGR